MALGVAKRTKLGIGDFSERAGLGKPLAANYFVSESMSTMTGNGTATGVGGSSGTSISSMPISGKTVGSGKGQKWNSGGTVNSHLTLRNCDSIVSCLLDRQMAIL